MNKLNQFKQELKSLLEKYDASIGLVADNGSDWWGVTGENLVVEFAEDDTIQYSLNDYGLWLEAGDLEG